MKAINGISVEVPVRIGKVLASIVLGTGVDIVATRSVERQV